MSTPIGSNPTPVAVPAQAPDMPANAQAPAQPANPAAGGPVDGYENITPPIEQVLQNLGLQAAGIRCAIHHGPYPRGHVFQGPGGSAPE